MMTRKEFLKNLATLGIGLPFLGTIVSSCEGYELIDPTTKIDYTGKVLIIGAGAAGLTAGYILHQNNIDFQIIEASPMYGGRVKKSTTFTDVPIDLGAEWIHTDPSILSTLVNDTTNDVDIETIRYRPQTHAVWKDDELKSRNFAKHFYAEYKFKNTTWYDFFEKFIVPDIAAQIIYNSPINEVDYAGDKVIVKTIHNESYTADKVIITVPTSILKNNSITFRPAFTNEKKEALSRAYMPDGIKVFIEFSERFYPDMLSIGSLLGDDAQERIFYDAMFRKDVDKNILALFNVGESASEYTNLATDTDIINTIMSQLDEIFDGKPSDTYQQHIIQNWSKEPYIQGSYTHYTDEDKATVEALAKPIGNQVYFAGEATVYEEGATVHGAALSAYYAIQHMFEV